MEYNLKITLKPKITKAKKEKKKRERFFDNRGNDLYYYFACSLIISFSYQIWSNLIHCIGNI